jgi:hypothetical protein
VSVTVGFKKPRKRTAAFYTMVPDDIRYLEIEVDGKVVYDSRTEVPCDIEEWHATRARFPESPITSSRVV